MSEVKEETFAAGKTVYNEGGPGDAIFIIADGKVEVLRKVGTKQARLAVLTQGSLFGESGVIRNTTRSTSVRTLEPTTLMVIPKAAFDATFNRENPLALTLLRALCDRLAQANMKLLTHEIYSTAVAYNEVKSIHLKAGSPEMLSQIGSDGLEIKRLPFHVGRHVRPEEKATTRKAELVVQASYSDDMSPMHFAIENDEGRLIIRDLTSHLGTLVNKRRIGHFEEFSVADVRFGSTTIQAGGLDSPYRFILVVERKEG